MSYGFSNLSQHSKMFYGAAFTTALLLISTAGCRRDTPTVATTPAPTAKVVAKPMGEAAPVKLTASQNMGLTILKALNATPTMKGHAISVGTTADTVILNGPVQSAAQKKMAETIARKNAKNAKVINKIEVKAAKPKK